MTTHRGPVEIVTVKTARQLKTFIGFPYRLNRDDHNWVPPLRLTQKQLLVPSHPFWKKNPYAFFLAYKNGNCAGRIAAFVNLQHNIHFQAADGCFGYLEAIDDPEVFRALLEQAMHFVQSHRCTRIIGPLNPDIHNELGVLVYGFDSPPYFMLTHNPLYYDAQLHKHGFGKLKDFYSYLLHEAEFVPTPKIERVKQALARRYGLQVRNPDMKRFKEELALFHEIYNDAFMSHWGFVPIEKDEFVSLAKDMKSIIDPRLVFIAEYKGEPVAFLLCLPNLNEILIRIRNGRLLPTGIFKLLAGRKKIESARVITVAVKHAYQHWGIGALLYPEAMKQGRAQGLRRAELSWVAEDNDIMNRIAQDLRSVPYKTYRLYGRQL